MNRLVLLLLVAASGCGSGMQEYMPLTQNSSWKYLVRLDAEESTETLQVVRDAPVGDVKGWLLASEMGSCRLGWDGDALLAAELAGTLYSPPIPLLARDGTEWAGFVTTPAGKSAATARLVRSREGLDVAGRKYDSLKTVLTLRSNDGRIQLTTWFFPGLGILRQEQRSGPALKRDRFIEFVSGPN